MKLQRQVRYLGWLLIVAVAAFVYFRFGRTTPEVPAVEECPRDPSAVLVTGYCNCGDCCGWEYSWFGLGGPVYNYGSMKGKPKEVGKTASGTKAHHGTVAADPKVYKFGTKIYIPGYGEGVVEDIGGAIKGKHIDVWFPSHEEARRWGRKWLKIDVIRK